MPNSFVFKTFFSFELAFLSLPILFLVVRERGLIIVSPEERRAVRFHVSELVHRILRQLIFKFRKHDASCAPRGLSSIWQTKKPESDHRTRTQPSSHVLAERINRIPDSESRIFSAGSDGKRAAAAQTQSSCPTILADRTGSYTTSAFRATGFYTPISSVNQEASVAHTTAQGSTEYSGKPAINNVSPNKRNIQVSKSQTEYLLICPEFPERGKYCIISFMFCPKLFPFFSDSNSRPIYCSSCLV